MTISEHSTVLLKRHRLGFRPGAVGVVVHSYRNGEAFEVEFLSPDGNTLGVAAVASADLLDTSQMNLRFRLQFWLFRSWLFRFLAWVRSKFVPQSRGFGRWDSFFRDGPRVSDDFKPDRRPLLDPKNDHLFTKEAAHQAFGHLRHSDESEKLAAPRRHPLLKTNDEFEKLKARRDEHGLVRRTPDQQRADRVALARFAAKSARHPLFGPQADTLFRDLPPAEAFEQLENLREAQRIERWKTILAVSAGAAGAIALAIAVVALFFTR